MPAASRLVSSRLGPTAPDAPAALSVWQPAQPESAKTCAPVLAFAAAAGDAVVSLSAPIRLGPTTSSRATSAAATHVTGARIRSNAESAGPMPDPRQPA